MKAPNGYTITLSQAYSRAKAGRNIANVKETFHEAVIKSRWRTHAASPHHNIMLNSAAWCLKCGKIIPEGAEAYWIREQGVWHIECAASRESRKRSIHNPVLASILAH